MLSTSTATRRGINRINHLGSDDSRGFAAPVLSASGCWVISSGGNFSRSMRTHLAGALQPYSRSRIIRIASRRGKHIASPPLGTGGRILPLERFRQPIGAYLCAQVRREARPLTAQPIGQRPDVAFRERCPAVLATVASANHDFPAVQVDVLQPKRHTFGHAQATAVHQRRAGSAARPMPGSASTPHSFYRRKVRQVGAHNTHIELPGMTALVKQNIAPNSQQVRPLGLYAVATSTKLPPHACEQPKASLWRLAIAEVRGWNTRKAVAAHGGLRGAHGTSYSRDPSRPPPFSRATNRATTAPPVLSSSGPDVARAGGLTPANAARMRNA